MRRNGETLIRGRYGTRHVELTPGTKLSATWVSLMALTERVHSDGAIPPGRRYFFLIFLLPESLIIWDASHELLDAIPVVEAWETQSGVFFLQHVVIVRLDTLLLDPTLDIFLLFTRRKRVVGIVL